MAPADYITRFARSSKKETEISLEEKEQAQTTTDRSLLPRQRE